jgi:hypothetical protein
MALISVYFLLDITIPPDVVLFSYIRGRFVYCLFFLVRFKHLWDLVVFLLCTKSGYPSKPIIRPPCSA